MVAPTSETKKVFLSILSVYEPKITDFKLRIICKNNKFIHSELALFWHDCNHIMLRRGSGFAAALCVFLYLPSLRAERAMRGESAPKMMRARRFSLCRRESCKRCGRAGDFVGVRTGPDAGSPL